MDHDPQFENHYPLWLWNDLDWGSANTSFKEPDNKYFTFRGPISKGYYVSTNKRNFFSTSFIDKIQNRIIIIKYNFV